MMMTGAAGKACRVLRGLLPFSVFDTKGKMIALVDTAPRAAAVAWNSCGATVGYFHTDGIRYNVWTPELLVPPVGVIARHIDTACSELP